MLAFPDRVFKAKLSYIAPSIDANTHRLPVRAEVENPDGALKPEMFADFTHHHRATRDAGPAVPESAIVYEGDTARVWVARPNGSLALAPDPGRAQPATAWSRCLTGLPAGEKIVTTRHPVHRPRRQRRLSSTPAPHDRS